MTCCLDLFISSQNILEFINGKNGNSRELFFTQFIKFKPVAVKFNQHLNYLSNTGDVRDRKTKEDKELYQQQVLTDLFSPETLELLGLFTFKQLCPLQKTLKLNPQFSKILFPLLIH